LTPFKKKINFDQEDTRQLGGACSRNPLNSKLFQRYLFIL
jgi:hypothetical protein